MRLFLSAALVLVGLAQASGPSNSAQPPVAATKHWSEVLTRPSSSGQARALNDLRAMVRLRDAQARQPVLVVPTPELAPDGLAAITEDLTVMCRIFDKALGTGTQSVRTFAYTGRVDTLQRLLIPQTQQTQALYLDGYGTLFFIAVDFPLAGPAPSTPPGQPQRQEAGDQVWSQTVKELHGQQDETDQASQAEPVYDAQRVENLENTLVEALRHAANIRTHRPQDYVVLVIGTPTDGDNYGIQWFRQKSKMATASSWPQGQPRAAQAAELSPDPAATLILRAVKEDINAFAAGQLTYEQFQPKVETFWSSVPPEASSEASATSK
jgi:hypothetical protein